MSNVKIKTDGIEHYPWEIVSYCGVCGTPIVSIKRRKYCSSWNGLTPCQKEGERRRVIKRRAERNHKNCACCGNNFQAKKSDQKYCSDACKMKEYRRAKKLPAEPSRIQIIPPN